MIIDLACLIFASLYAVFGYFVGGLLQAVKLAALVLAYLGSIWMAPILRAWLAEHVGNVHGVGQFMALAACWLVLYLLLYRLGKMLVVSLKEGSETVGVFDGLLGVFLGIVKAALILVILILLLGMVKDQVFKTRPETIAVFQESHVMRFMARTGAIDYITPDETLRLYRHLKAQLLDEKQPSQTKPVVKKKKKDSVASVEKALKNPKLLQDLQSENIFEVINSPEFQALLRDPNVRKAIEKHLEEKSREK